MIVPQPRITRVVVETFDVTRYGNRVCPIGKCRAPIADHEWFDTDKRGTVACSLTSTEG